MIRVFDGVFDFLTSGFRVIWCAMSSVFTLIGVALMGAHFRNRDTERRLEGTASQLILRKSRKGLTLREEVFPRESYLDIRARQTGHVNNQPRFKIELLADGRAIALAQWVKPEDAETFVAAVKRAIG